MCSGQEGHGCMGDGVLLGDAAVLLVIGSYGANMVHTAHVLAACSCRSGLLLLLLLRTAEVAVHWHVTLRVKKAQAICTHAQATY